MKRGKFWSLAAVAGTSIASGWIGVGINRLLGEKDSMESAGTAIWIASPLAAVVTTRLVRREPVFTACNPCLPASLPWYAIGTALFPAISMSALQFGRSRGWVSFDRFDSAGHLRNASKGLAPALLKNVFEEYVWRGFFVHELLKSGMSTRKINLIVSVIWGLWHIPYYLWFLPEEEIRGVTGLSRNTFAVASTPVLLSWSGPYTEIYRASGSIWPSVLMHSVEDVFVNGLVAEHSIEIAPGRRALLDPITGALPLSLYVLAGIVMRRLAFSQPD